MRVVNCNDFLIDKYISYVKYANSIFYFIIRCVYLANLVHFHKIQLKSIKKNS